MGKLTQDSIENVNNDDSMISFPHLLYLKRDCLLNEDIKIEDFKKKFKSLIPEKDFRSISKCFKNQDYQHVAKPDVNQNMNKDLDNISHDNLNDEFYETME